MNTTTVRTMMAAAALVIAASTASAQTFQANVPVPFQVAGKTMAAGSYDIRLTLEASEPLLVVRNRETHNTAALVPSMKGDAPKSWQASGEARIALVCSASACVLQKLWTGSDSFAYQFAAPKPAGDLLAQRSELLTLTMIKVR